MLNRKFVLLMSMAVVLVGLIAVPAFAGHIGHDPDTLKMVCTGSTACTSGSTSLVTLSGNPTFDLFETQGHAKTGDMFLAILVPNGIASFSVAGGSLEENPTFNTGFLTDALNEGWGNGYQFSSIASASAQVGVTATWFTAYEYDLGSIVCPGNSGTCTSVSLGPLPKGTVILAWQEATDGNTYKTPLSESLTSGGVVPEPGAMLLMGTFLLGAYGTLRRKLKV